MSAPLVSVIMAAYNSMPHIERAVRSVLEQSLSDLELIVVDDGSSDDTWEFLSELSDPRVRVVRDGLNRGPSPRRNEALRMATGNYVAVLDADDVAYPERLAVQCAFLDGNPDVALVACAFDLIDSDDHCVGTTCRPTEPAPLAWAMLFDNVLALSMMTFRRDAACHVRGFEEADLLANDYAFSLAMAGEGRVVALRDVLGAYRISPGSMSASNGAAMRTAARAVSARRMASLLGRDVTIAEVSVATGCGLATVDAAQIEQCIRMLSECAVRLFDLHPEGRLAILEGVLERLCLVGSEGWRWRSRCLHRGVGLGKTSALGPRAVVPLGLFALRLIAPRSVRAVVSRMRGRRDKWME